MLLAACGPSSQSADTLRVVTPEPAAKSLPAPKMATTPVVVVAKAAPVQPEIPVPEPTSLMGMLPTDITNLLGEPSLKRSDAPAQLWQYRTASCALNLFLYPTAGPSSLSVSHYEAVTLSNGVVSDKSCLGSIMKNKIVAAS